jgi:hypothetical protein
MAYVSDASTLADVVGPAEAASQMNTSAAQQRVQQGIANQVAAGQAPAEIAKPGLANMFTQAQTANEQGVAGQNLAKGAVDQALVPSEIGAGQAKNTGIQTQAQADQLNSMGQIMGQVGGILQNTDPQSRPQAVAALAQRFGIPIQALGALAQGDPNQWTQAGQAVQKASSDFVTKNALESQRVAGAQGVATTEATARTTAAETSANARKYAADTNQRIKEISQNQDQLAATLQRRIVADGQHPDPNDVAMLQAIQQQQVRVRQMQAQNTAQLVGNGELANVPSYQAPDGQAPTTAPTQAAPAPSGGGSGDALQDAMRARGLIK